MAKFVVDTAALMSAVEQMSAFENRLEESLVQAQAMVDSLGPAWHGQASEAQRAAQAEWHEGAAEMRRALSRLRSIADVAHMNYSGAAAMNSRMWS